MSHYASMSLIGMIRPKLKKGESELNFFQFVQYYPAVYPSGYIGLKEPASITLPHPNQSEPANLPSDRSDSITHHNVTVRYGKQTSKA